MHEIPIRCFAVSVVILRPAGSAFEFLLLRRTGTLAGTWCQVAGAIEAGETAWQAGLREVVEETGLHPNRFYSADICEQFYEADRNAISLLPVFVGYAPQDDAEAWAAELEGAVAEPGSVAARFHGGTVCALGFSGDPDGIT